MVQYFKNLLLWKKIVLVGVIPLLVISILVGVLWGYVRKLDFLLQELNREANTIGSKGNDVEQARTVVEIKAELEKIREQTQNIE